MRKYDASSHRSRHSLVSYQRQYQGAAVGKIGLILIGHFYRRISTDKLLIWRIIFFVREMNQCLRLDEIHMKSLLLMLLVSKVSKFYLALIERWRTKMWKYIYLVQCTKIIDTFWKVSFVCNNVLLFAFRPKLVHKSYTTMQQFAKMWIVIVMLHKPMATPS